MFIRENKKKNKKFEDENCFELSRKKLFYFFIFRKLSGMHKNIYVVGSFITLWSSKLCLRAIGKIIIPPLQTQFILTKTWKVFLQK